ncbi:uncharacterized protein LOC129000230 [Macrosteles quadrilineatus]|uniref:uncharacterized protein LOC129000230 n=1 Tax=Macrosteles quadrilineatus TaxID=74068 RepID=UPI0023E28EDC|nr:uncharacterized protein LOC129000230 [Macrosteles quadrilineatus]
MTFGRLRCPLLFQYTLEGQPLERVFSIKDLGVTFSADLSFHEHVYDLCKRSHRLLGYIFRSTRGMTSPVVLKTLYSSFVRQLLEYASPVWPPYQVGLTDELDAVQRKFLRLVGVRQGLRWTEVPLADLQADLHLHDLQVRREVADVVFLAKLINGLLDCPMLLTQVDFRTPSVTRSLDLFGRRHHARGYDFHSPLARIMRLGNRFCHTVDFFHENTSSVRRRVLEARHTIEHI